MSNTPPAHDSAAERPELAAACARAALRIASPGTWWSAPERLAIALETRAAWSCRLCAKRKESLSPEVAGEHDLGSLPGLLPSTAIEAVHRLTTDPARLHRGWLERLTAGGLSAEHYVELVGVLTQILSVDEQDRALGHGPRPLPNPQTGTPSKKRPRGAKPGPGWLPTVAPADLDEEDRDLYGGRSAGNVIRALSLVPNEVRALQDLGSQQYVPGRLFFDMSFRRSLDRAQIEWVAARVSALNECFY